MAGSGGKRSRRIVGLVSAALLVATVAACSTRLGRVVRSADGTPIAGATVRFADTTGKVTTTTTDADGNYNVDLLVPGLYAVSVTAPGFVPQTRRLAEDQLVVSWVLAADAAPGDPDADGLSTGAEATFGTDPFHGDSDRDGISDGDEALVRGTLGLPGLGADPRHHDIFIEIDRDATNPGTGTTDITAEMLGFMDAVYANGPVANPDGTSGVRAHIDTGQLGGGEALTDVPPGWGCSTAGFDGATHLAPERRTIFFHVLSGDLSGCGLYGLAYSTRRVVVDVGQPKLAQLQGLVGAGTILHELGHTLGLLHGGDESFPQCKPNYPSVMNYDPVPLYLNGVDYSRGLQAPIDERAIDETQQFYSYADYDWNHDGVIQTSTYAADIDDWSWLQPGFEALMLTVFTPARCPTNGINASPLHDFDDWARIVTNLPKVVGISIPAGPAAVVPLDRSDVVPGRVLVTGP